PPRRGLGRLRASPAAAVRAVGAGGDLLLPARAAAALRLRRWTASKWLPDLRPGTDSLFGGAAASTTTTRRLMSQGYGPQGKDWRQWGQSDPNQQPQGGQPDKGQPWGQASTASQCETPQ